MKQFKNQVVQLKKDQPQVEFLNDVSSTGRKLPWSEKKISAELVALAYDEINPSKASRIRDCASFLGYSTTSDGKMKLKHANFCRVGLCPICLWRRSLKIFAHTQKIMQVIKKDDKYAYIFITLTIRNCYGSELQECIDIMFKAWHRFIGYKAVKNAVKGWYRGFEVTHNVNPLSKSYDTYHPHFHCILAIDKSYFKKKDYIKQSKWTSLWKKALKIDYNPVVDVRKVKGDTAKAVAEVAKYAVQEGDYILPEDWDLSVNTIRLLDNVLYKRKLVAYGGIFKEIHRLLNLDDEIDGDLVHTSDEDKEEEIVDNDEKWFIWNVGYRCHIRIK